MKKALVVMILLAIVASVFTVSYAYEDLEKGSKGDEVTQLQERLNELGYSVGKADGSFGGKTYNAVCDLERDNDREVTGVVDEELHDLIFSDSIKTKAEIEAYNNSPEGFQLNVAAAKKIGDKFCSGKIEAADKCSSEEDSDEYHFSATDFDTRNGELYVSCTIDKARGADNISPSLYIAYTIPIGSGLWFTDGPNILQITTNKGSHQLPKSMWSWSAGTARIRFDGHEDLFEEMAKSSSVQIYASNLLPSSLTIGYFKKNTLGCKAVKTAWEIWKAAGCDKLDSMH